jgi:3-oxoadipate enol-lactonase
LGIKSAFVVGVAYGARTAAQFALRHPTMLSGLGMFDVALTPPVDQGDQGALGAKAMAMLKDAGMAIPERQKYWRFYENRDAALACHSAHQREGDTMAALSADHCTHLSSLRSARHESRFSQGDCRVDSPARHLRSWR